jgi:hypothetical protein
MLVKVNINRQMQVYPPSPHANACPSDHQYADATVPTFFSSCQCLPKCTSTCRCKCTHLLLLMPMLHQVHINMQMQVYPPSSPHANANADASVYPPRSLQAVWPDQRCVGVCSEACLLHAMGHGKGPASHSGALPSATVSHVTYDQKCTYQGTSQVLLSPPKYCPLVLSLKYPDANSTYSTCKAHAGHYH